jgi:signal transduction histidine kinase
MGWAIVWRLPMIFKRLQTRLIFVVGLLAVAAVCAVAISARHLTRVEFRRLQEHEHSAAAAQRAAKAASTLVSPCCSAEALRRASAQLAPDQALVLVDEHGRLIRAAGPGLDAGRLRELATRTERGMLKISGRLEDSGRTQQLSLQIRGPAIARLKMTDGTSALAYVVFIPHKDELEPASAFLGSVDRRLLLATAVVGALALVLVCVIARRIAGPIGELNEAASDIAHGNLSRRVKTSGSDEVTALSHTFNAMASELERQQRVQKHLIQDVAHELRTPLTALQCRLETMVDGLATDPRSVLEDATEEVRHLSRLLDDLQEIAIAESRRIELKITDVEIADLILSSARAAGLDHDSRFRVEVEEGLMVRADAVRTRQVIINLLTNARQHSRLNGDISVHAFRRDDVVAVEVRNTGSHLREDQLPRVFDRFYRADPARQRSTGGTGLGLTIVKHLVEAQGGRVSAASDAAGVTIGFTLPACP